MSLHQNNKLLAHHKCCFVSHWPSEIGMLLINFLELGVVETRGRKLASRQHSVTLPRPCHNPAMALTGRFQKGIVVARQGNGMVCVNQTRPHCVNKMGKTQSKALPERHGRGTAWERHGMCESAFMALHSTGHPATPVALTDTHYVNGSFNWPMWCEVWAGL
jgi:hypothetical protein